MATITFTGIYFQHKFLVESKFNFMQPPTGIDFREIHTFEGENWIGGYKTGSSKELNFEVWQQLFVRTSSFEKVQKGKEKEKEKSQMNKRSGFATSA